jgi:hypothetical protein
LLLSGHVVEQVWALLVGCVLIRFGAPMTLCRKGNAKCVECQQRWGTANDNSQMFLNTSAFDIRLLDIQDSPSEYRISIKES